ncbi:MAG: thioredoxin family protein [Crocinitomicaceae bacterium]|nr:thioredoxin family protein [Crocinitomicaceae bacterium]
MLKRILFFLAIIAVPNFLLAQDEMPGSVDEVIIWNFSVEYDNCEAWLVFKIDQKDGWHIYAQKQPEGAVAYPTTFIFKENPNYKLIGSPKEYGSESHNNEGIPEKMFPGNQAKFKQRIEILSENDFEIEVEYEYMACKTSCFPPTYRETKFNVKGKTEDCDTSGEVEEGSEENQDENETSVETKLDSTLEFLQGTCEGFHYTEVFDPVKVRVNEPWRTDKKNYSVSFSIEIDSIFAMYAFDNPEGISSVFKLQDDQNIESQKEYTTTIKKIIGDKTKGYKYRVSVQQNFTVKDTSKLAPVKGELDLFLMGCSNTFHNTEKVELTWDLPNAQDNGTRTEKDSLWIIFILAFGGGLLALLTPCVFPMIPMTVSFFTKQSKTRAQGLRKAFLYSSFIIIIYEILGVLVSQLAGADALNAMATNPWVNIVFFVLFIVFAISFFGAFEITLPNSWVNKADKQADKGGLIGIFFMALTLALVSFSCTGPIVGSVLVQSAAGGLSGPMIAMLGFSLALALPFGLFAAFPGWLNSLPQSGGWLNSVKVVLGFIEVALALKFLSNADLVMQWHILERELFLSIWIAVFLMLFIYLIGKIQFPHDSPLERISVGRGVFALIVLGFTIYLIPGIWGAPLKMISGFPPPLTYAESPYGIHGHAPEVGDEWPETTHPHGHGINTIRDYNDALEYAKKVDKPLLLDFTGWACVNCRKMEEFVWADPEVAPIMANDFVIASLYVDDRTDVPEKYSDETNINGAPLRTIGELWTKMEIERYDEITQPMYVIIDHNENNISGKANYDSHGNVTDFKKWLEKGKQAFANTNSAKLIVPEFEVYNKSK